MILSQSSLNKFRFYLLLLAILALPGCMAPGGGARAVVGTPVPLTARAAGPAEVAGQVFEFHLRRDGRDLGVVHAGTAPVWEWTPQEPGEYQTRTVVRDPAGKILVESDWSAPYEVVPPLTVQEPAADRPAPQTAGTAIRWTTAASGGAGEISYGFELRPEGAATATAQSGPESKWLWHPEQAGRYQVRVVVVDAHGNRAESGWSDPYEVLPRLAVKAPAPDRSAQQAAGTAIRWTAQASGGVGEISYEFELRPEGAAAATVQSGPSPEWRWSPAKAGLYQVRAVAVDTRGNRAASDWSAPYEVVPPLAVKTPVADRPAPRAAGSAIRWTVQASGGVGEISYGFELQPEGAAAATAQSGPSPDWLWSPVEAGHYLVWVEAADAHGNRAASEWSVPYEIVPPLKVERMATEQPAPQTAGTGIRWMTQASGGVGEVTYAFELRAGDEKAAAAQSGPLAEWLWSPAEAGRYQARVVATDTRGNRAASEWSVPYEIVLPLKVERLATEQPAPQPAGTAIRWMTQASGGVGEITYGFEIQREGAVAVAAQSGLSTEWIWNPTETGRYQARVVATDTRGNRAASEWSAPYEVVPPLKVTKEPLIAVLPIENLSGAGGAPTKQLRQALKEELAKAGFTLLGDDRLDQFMVRHRIRYVGGIDTATAKAFLKETGTNAVLVTSLALYLDGDPPKIALFSRLVSTGDRPEILWMDGVGMAGDASAGLLGLGLIHDPKVLRDKALSFLVSSLSKRQEGKTERSGFFKRTRTFRPKITYSASFLEKGKRYPVVVVPFSSEGERTHAGEIMALHFVRQLAAMDGYSVVEPGVVREKLLGLRVVMDQGISRSDLYVVSSSLGTDLLLGGKVTKYLDSNLTGGAPKVDFSALLMEGAGRKIIWAADSYNQGDDGVFFFDAGMVHTAFEMTSKMVSSLLTEIERSRGTPGKENTRKIDLLEFFRGEQKQ